MFKMIDRDIDRTIELSPPQKPALSGFLPSLAQKVLISM
jgi:hypothetical protein